MIHEPAQLAPATEAAIASPGPIFIMGEHRSGTTLLYQLLTNSGAFNPLTLHHILRFDQLEEDFRQGRQEAARAETNALLQRRGIHDRMMDSVKVNADMPEEYGFLLLKKAGYLKLRPQSLAAFQEMCRCVQAVSPPGKPLLLKNPWDYIRFAIVKQLVPDARFVFIHRDPLATISSQLRGFRSSLETVNPYAEVLSKVLGRLQNNWLARKVLSWSASPYSGHLTLRMMVSQSRKSREYYRTHVGQLPPDCWTTIEYEELCRQPEAVLSRLLQFLGVPEAYDPALAKQISPRNPTPLPEVVRFAKSLVNTTAIPSHG